MRVRVTLTVELDRDAYRDAYGPSTAAVLRYGAEPRADDALGVDALGDAIRNLRR